MIFPFLFSSTILFSQTPDIWSEREYSMNLKNYSLNGKVKSIVEIEYWAKKGIFKIRKDGKVHLILYEGHETDRKMIFNENGFLIESKSIYGKRSQYHDGYSLYEYDSANNLVKETCNHNYFSHMRVMNRNNQQICDTYLDSSNNEIDCITLRYDTLNGVFTYSEFIHDDLIFKLSQSKDEMGNKIIRKDYPFDQSSYLKILDSLSRPLKKITERNLGITEVKEFTYSDDFKYQTCKIFKSYTPFETKIQIRFLDEKRNLFVDSTYITDSLGQFLRLDKTIHFSLRNPKLLLMVHQYNKYGDETLEKYDYKFDKNDNWVRKIKWVKGELYSVTERKIKYYK